MTKLIRPLFYHCRRGVNHYHWIIKKMRIIPDAMRREVSDRYETLYLTTNDAGKAANEYLKEVSYEYKPEVKGCEIKLKKPPAKKVKPGNKAREYKSKCRLWSKEL